MIWFRAENESERGNEQTQRQRSPGRALDLGRGPLFLAGEFAQDLLLDLGYRARQLFSRIIQVFA